ncbi:Nicotinate-nucleotide pyrophosphorylase [carboxylating] [Rubripirellula obstinata]|uniref:Probable nicotinate-nucleotide pyrophosphorylase [carboxylating] n=1 Tax=Rubripirellula obstinata TaxID=406547 RepID=A0A5B1CL34_9BACT|nr:carboxylating nicotinate-nucleotide diphosphorylase [Rubripirellula obstinata]KAA1260103.1 Nicotinate-nucleotide pyrophosphorylase [carboxylating] [Rubripirellula obstinata]
MPKDYTSVVPNLQMKDDLQALVRLAIAEDLRDQIDWTTVCLIDDSRRGGCRIVPRKPGVCAGADLMPWIIEEFDADLQVEIHQQDGTELVPQKAIASIVGNVRDLLTAERTVLNLLSRLCGIATLTKQYVDAIEGTKSRLYDTRKTTPGWRLIEKYAVRCGGATSHRSGLHDGFLIKDNHLALAGDANGPIDASVAAAKAIAWRGGTVERMNAPEIVEIEVDSLDQFRDVLPSGPDIILLDNFALESLAEAVAIRDAAGSPVELEASGNVTIDTIASIAATGVNRISSGALTHQATSLDLGFDWFDADVN